MATKGAVYDYIQLFNSKSNKIIDIYNTLAICATEIKFKLENGSTEPRFIIFSNTGSIYSLAKVIMTENECLKSRETVEGCLRELKTLGTLCYDEKLSAWYLPNLTSAVSQIKDTDDEAIKSKKKGYLSLKSIFFTERFYAASKNDKKLLLFSLLTMECMTTNSQKKTFRRIHKADFLVNVEKSFDELAKKNINWVSILGTNNIHYARLIIKSFINDNKDLIQGVEDSYTKKSAKFKFNIIRTMFTDIKSISLQDEYLQLVNKYKEKFEILKEIAEVRNFKLEEKFVVTSLRTLKTYTSTQFRWVTTRAINKILFGGTKISSLAKYLIGTGTDIFVRSNWSIDDPIAKTMLGL
ncbi:MAG: hypothetical protein RR620_08570 [Clostridium sp.]